MRFPNLSNPDVRDGLHALVRAILAFVFSAAALSIIFFGDNEDLKKWATGIVGLILGYYLK